MTPDKIRKLQDKEFDEDKMARIVRAVDEVISMTREEEREMVERETQNMDRISGSEIVEKKCECWEVLQDKPQKTDEYGNCIFCGRDLLAYQHAIENSVSEELLKKEKLNKTLQDLLEITKVLDSRIYLLVKRVDELEKNMFILK